MHAAPTLRAVFFDHDGTLVDSEPVHFHLWSQVLAALGAHLDSSEYMANHAGMPTLHNAQRMVRRFGLPLSAGSLARLKEDALARLLEREAFPLMPAARESVGFLKQRGLAVGIVTGAGGAGVVSTLSHHFRGAGMDVVVTGDDVTRSKPAPDVYLQAAARLGLEASQCVAVEDSSPGLRSALQAGMPCVAVPGAMSRDHDFRGAAHVVADLSAATQWIRDQFGLG